MQLIRDAGREKNRRARMPEDYGIMQELAELF